MKDPNEETNEGAEDAAHDDMEQDADALKNQGNELYRCGEYKEALKFYDRAVMSEPDNAKLYGNRAAALMMLGRHPEVIADCKRAIELDPSFAKAYGRLAKAYFQAGDFQRSLEKYHEALTLEINPDLKKEMDQVETARVCYNKSKAFLEQRDFDKALSYARLVLKEATDAVPFKVLFCEALIFNGKPEDACRILASVMMDHFNDPDVLTARARSLFFTGTQHVPQACKHLLRALEHDPDHDGSRKLLKQIRLFENLKSEGNASFSSKNWPEAIDAYTKALEVEPANRNVNGVLRCNRAAAYKEQGLLTLAIEDCTAAIETDSGYIKAYQRRARCHLAAEDYENAVRDFEQVIQLQETREAVAELREAKILLKRSKTKDYYKILGVPRDADEPQIKKAYREQALRLHPDKMAGGTEEEKAKTEQQFKDVGEAYSVLTDTQKRRRYDAGTYDENHADGGHDPSDFFGPQVFFNNGGHGHGRRSQQFSFHM
eukprot:TRINITY_DN2091_c0_g1_i1.p1 TRINITY_DN2091_c0_g1~~TRINITY_DN2091_c0_g1_i1.p1  ORF type:complete len:500 (+),score=143.06 TRINITY_DN2091_c0_g1_i1:34-1500(+)